MNSVVKGASYILAHTPDMVLLNGTTQTTERVVNPDSEYLKELPKHIRSYDEAKAYYPNQAYIGNITPDELAKIPMPFNEQKCDLTERFGKFGEIMPEDEFILLMQICDVFGLVELDKNFVAATKPALEKHPLMREDILARVKEGIELADIEKLVAEEHSEPLMYLGKLVGCVKRAHDVDANLSAHVMHENIVSKASSVLSLLHLVRSSGIDPDEIEYVIDCCEEACGDMNQRGGGNFAKSCAEIAGFNNATGSDVRGFCAGPAHAFIYAASLVKAGAYKNVVVSAGGCTAKLGMNGKDHVKKDLPILEDVLGGFAVLIGENDGVNPEINLDILGRHTCGTSSGPQDVTTALVFKPLEDNDLKVTDIDKFAGELHNSDILKPAGGGDPALQFFKVVAATAVKRGEMDKAAVATFPAEHGMVGWAPTQGHIPSGAPYIGFCRDDILEGRVNKAMFVGKGSLFLGRLTNLFDGCSFVMQKNEGAKDNGGVSEAEVKALIGKAMQEFAQNLLNGLED